MARQLSDGAIKNDFRLTSFEKQVIALVVAGYTSKESAQRIGVSERNLRQHLKNVSAKLGVSNQLELIFFALHHHLTSPPQTIPPLTEKRQSQTSRQGRSACWGKMGKG